MSISVNYLVRSSRYWVLSLLTGWGQANTCDWLLDLPGELVKLSQNAPLFSSLESHYSRMIWIVDQIQNHRIIERLGLEGTLKTISSSSLLPWAGIRLDQVFWGTIKPWTHLQRCCETGKLRPNAIKAQSVDSCIYGGGSNDLFWGGVMCWKNRRSNVSLGRIPTGPSLRGIKMQTILEIKYESNKDGNQAEKLR